MEATFQVDLDILQDPLVAANQKEWMLDLILSQIVPYRYYQEPRLFPELAFYGTLLNNRADFCQIWSFVTRFHVWIYDLAITNSEMADQAIESLKQMQQSLEIESLLEAATSAGPSPADYPSPPGTVTESIPVTPQQATTSSSRAPKSAIVVSDHPLLVAELDKPALCIYQGIIKDREHFAEINNAYNRHVKRQPGLTPEEDHSWPQSTEKCIEYIQEMYSAITSTNDFFELRKAKERLAKVRAKTADSKLPEAQEQGVSGSSATNDPRKRKATEERPKGLSKADWDLLKEDNSASDRLNTVIHHKITDVEIEVICWQLLIAAEDAQRGFTMKPLWSGERTVSTWDHFTTFGERWSAMVKELLDCKILVHSLLRADWFAKFATAPTKERAAKLSNDLLNGRRDVQNQAGREIIREKTAANEWTSAEDFEIRTKDGQLVHKGGQIGDNARRQLAKRRKA
ncbi:hypothetical protein COL154_012657 [Colletotrichum chrysophilum]|uniref:uncharacterized protein n=1 Tax=Colletotrichum chrysophilum TaxID=1836956 RepID=UPI002300080B|nr:uncharacterized protein COL26b_013584 [Colletotrichum chrysophilum]KAJ0337883.1 hypothetical protein KNSL1_012669 [Colletotrichum chrysophilum]KAJ0352083.1 hypothetical protein COL154_012657 [Colletotrichum chrysophilum]KAJ0361815.1 hypothetical protein COL26b_013584 [Colletotrichum chrysophilum]